MNALDFPQGSAEWAQARAGRVTASRMGDVIAKLKSGGEAAVRKDYRAQLVAEILTGVPQEDDYLSKEMLWGIEQEPEARSLYEIRSGVLVDQVGFIVHPSIERAGASPDGLVTDGMVEFKCPKTATHLEYLMDGICPREYIPQIQWGIACAERAWCDFVSFDPRLPEKYRLFRVRVPRDNAYIGMLEAEVLKLLSEVDRMVATIRRFG